MNILLAILLVIAGIIAALLLIAAFLKTRHHVSREIVINVPRQKAFDFLRYLGNQDKFNKWAATDSGRTIETRGTDGTAGYVYAWRGKSAGEGAKEILSITEGKRIETEIRFTKPMKVSADVIMETESLSDRQTKVTFINSGTLKFPFNIMIPVAEKNFARDMDASLVKLKQILETGQ